MCCLQFVSAFIYLFYYLCRPPLFLPKSLARHASCSFSLFIEALFLSFSDSLSFPHFLPFRLNHRPFYTSRRFALLLADSATSLCHKHSFHAHTRIDRPLWLSSGLHVCSSDSLHVSIVTRLSTKSTNKINKKFESKKLNFKFRLSL